MLWHTDPISKADQLTALPEKANIPLTETTAGKQIHMYGPVQCKRREWGVNGIVTL